MTARTRGAYTSAQMYALVVLRMLIGWHLMYEGVAKMLNPYWTSAGWLAASNGPLSGFFVSLAAAPGRLEAVDLLNKWGLLMIGLALLVGFGERVACLLAAGLLFLYYIGNMPLGADPVIPAEGSYLIVNKTLIEFAAVLVLMVFPTSHLVGLRHLIGGGKR